MSEQALLEISQLQLHFFMDKGVVKAVDGVDLTVREGEVVGLVGESGCGKSVTSLAVMGLVEAPGKIVGGSIRFDGRDLTKLSSSWMTENYTTSRGTKCRCRMHLSFLGDRDE